MRKSIHTKIAALVAAASALALTGCSTEPQESAFDNPLPWQDGASVVSGAYEKLEYSAAVYDTSAGSDDARVKIADGTLVYTLDESDGYIHLSMTCNYVYNDSAPEKDRGKTDNIASKVEFEKNSFAVRRMEKTVDIADRADEVNRSYTVTADYYDAHKATYALTRAEGATQHTLKLPKNTCRDNEMMFFVARAQGLGKGTSTNFKMVNIFDSFANGKLTEYSMLVSCAEAKTAVDIGDWVKDRGVAAVTDEATGNVTYPVSCHNASIMINATHHGPPYVVLYSDAPDRKSVV